MRAIIYILLGAMAAALRFYGLGKESLWADELGQIIVARRGLWETITTSAGHRGNTPLDYVITHVMLQFGTSEVWLRLPAALFGIGAVWLLYLVGRRLFGLTVGLVATTLLALTPLHIYYSQELRFYSLATFAILATVYAFTLATEGKDRRLWSLFSAVATVALYSHYYALLVLVALGLWLSLFRRDALLPFVVSSATALLLFAPWLWWDVLRLGTLNSNPAPFVVPPFTELISGLFNSPDTPAGCFWRCQYGGWAATVGLPLLAVAALWTAQRRMVALPALVVGIGYAGVIALDAYGQYFFAYRQTLVFLPFLLLAVVGCLAAVSRRYALPVLSVALVMATVVFAPRIEEIYTVNGKADFRGTAAYLLSRMDDDNVLMTSVPEYLLFYEPELASHIKTVNRSDSLQVFESLRSENKTVWIVPYGSGGRVFDPVFKAYQRQAHPTGTPRIYAIPHPGEW